MYLGKTRRGYAPELVCIALRNVYLDGGLYKALYTLSNFAGCISCILGGQYDMPFKTDQSSTVYQADRVDIIAFPFLLGWLL